MKDIKKNQMKILEWKSKIEKKKFTEWGSMAEWRKQKTEPVNLKTDQEE